MARQSKGTRQAGKNQGEKNETVAKSDMELIISRLSEISNRRKVEALDTLLKLTPPIGTSGSGKAATKARLVAEDLDASGDLLALLPTG